MNEQRKYYGEASRFLIERFVSRDGDDAFMVRDASWVTDSEIGDGRGSPTVAQFATRQEAEEWCDFVEAGKITSVPHESNFEGWPGLKARVQGK